MTALREQKQAEPITIVMCDYERGYEAAEHGQTAIAPDECNFRSWARGFIDGRARLAFAPIGGEQIREGRMTLAQTLEPTTLDFASFKAGRPAREMFRKLGLEQYLEAATSWRMLRELIVHFNDCDKGNFVKLARDVDGVASSGERVLLHAICFVCDFAWLADELADCDAWRRMGNVGGEHQRAVAACILAFN